MQSNIEEKRLTATEAVRNFQEAAHLYAERKKAYNDGYEQGVRDLARKIKGDYNTLGGETFAPLVAFHIDEKVKEMMEDHNNET